MIIIYKVQCLITTRSNIQYIYGQRFNTYEGRAKSSVTNRLPWFYPRYILKCFTALEWCVEQLTIPVYFVQIAFLLTELFQIETDAVIYTDQFTCYIGTWTRRLKFVAILNATLGLI